MTDQERELFIEACGRRLVAAHAAGDTEAAQLWLTAESEAIKGRSQAQVDAMEQSRRLTA